MTQTDSDLHIKHIKVDKLIRVILPWLKKSYFVKRNKIEKELFCKK